MSEITTPAPSLEVPPPASLARAALGLGHLALHGAGQITELAAEVHESIARTPFSFFDRAPDSRRAPLPYRIVSGAFTRLAGALGHLALRLTPEREEVLDSEAWLFFRAILNGVLGDKLARWNSPLSLEMDLRDRHGLPLQGGTPAQGLVIFLHGLCMHDRGWMNPAHLAFVRAQEQQGRRVAWLRYNSGLPIGHNGRILAAQLETLCAGQRLPLHLVGHSMGGLLARSACHIGEVSGHSWLENLETCAYLSTPHQGAPYERMGHLANSLLGLTPYTRPFMRLGNIRSAAIRDLRYGNILEDSRPGDWDTGQADHRTELPPLTRHARHLLLGGGRDPRAAASWIGDGLVPVASAFGEHPDPTRRLTGERVERCRLEDLDHVAMLADPRVYARLESWLQPGSDD